MINNRLAPRTPAHARLVAREEERARARESRKWEEFQVAAWNSDHFHAAKKAWIAYKRVRNDPRADLMEMFYLREIAEEAAAYTAAWEEAWLAAWEAINPI